MILYTTSSESGSGALAIAAVELGIRVKKPALPCETTTEKVHNLDQILLDRPVLPGVRPLPLRG